MSSYLQWREAQRCLQARIARHRDTRPIPSAPPTAGRHWHEASRRAAWAAWAILMAGVLLALSVLIVAPAALAAPQLLGLTQ